jgi:phosphoribosyl-AMP cyclohydrolase / phosphoribosyl-ATP pyrophosphohydrolase
MSTAELKWGPDGLLPVVVADVTTGAVLTLAYANREALERTLSEKTTWFFSRSRQALWKKGETSGHTQAVVSVAYDCDGDALLYRVIPHGPACHTGAASCFHRELLSAGDTPSTGVFSGAVAELARTIAGRRNASPETSYTAKLLSEGVDRIAKKVGEEATEVVIASKNDDRPAFVGEVADLVYHTLVLLESRGVTLDEVGGELLRRAK